MQIMVVLRLTLTESTIILIEYGYKDSADVMLWAVKMTIINT
ncbi:hypothetical protein NMY3_03011 [Candidatus Nitrosocosmicus oleophilus]|jgi:hypothetical protein|uniref:Uncharacterized protein n=1 Tax=Candidatus Nitrosocosmicus oleophilus TaxID=1353260 RepID=A0A654M0E3_9ARCH|nr:hypothetical protein NMY3_03011 [Candidatus Nitrosocosmicus oleophilus]